MANRISPDMQNLDFPFSVELVWSDKRKKTVSFEVYTTKVVVRVPSTLSSQTLENMLRKHRQQLIHKWTLVNTAQQTVPVTSTRDEHSLLPDKVFMHGESYSVVYRTHADGDRFALQLVGKDMIISTPRGTVKDRMTIRVVKDLVESWLRKMARRDFVQRLDKYSSQMRVTYEGFRLKDQKTRWGSCSSLGNINLNWRLIQAPEWIIDYVVIHELAHLEELNHSQAFWRIVKRYCPNYQDAKKWLKTHGHELHRW